MAVGAALAIIPVIVAVLFAQIGWYWQALGWAGIAMSGLIAAMIAAVIGLALREAEARPARTQLEAQAAGLAMTQEVAAALAEMMWCERRRDQLLEKHRTLNGALWDKAVHAYRDASHSGECDLWTPAAEEVALWAQHHLPALYTSAEFDTSAPETAADETGIAEDRQSAFRDLYWRKTMMARYVETIITQLDARAEELRGDIAEAGCPLAHQARQSAS